MRGILVCAALVATLLVSFPTASVLSSGGEPGQPIRLAVATGGYDGWHSWHYDTWRYDTWGDYRWRDYGWHDSGWGGSGSGDSVASDTAHDGSTDCDCAPVDSGSGGTGSTTGGADDAADTAGGSDGGKDHTGGTGDVDPVSDESVGDSKQLGDSPPKGEVIPKGDSKLPPTDDGGKPVGDPDGDSDDLGADSGEPSGDPSGGGHESQEGAAQGGTGEATEGGDSGGASSTRARDDKAGSKSSPPGKKGKRERPREPVAGARDAAGAEAQAAGAAGPVAASTSAKAGKKSRARDRGRTRKGAPAAGDPGEVSDESGVAGATESGLGPPGRAFGGGGTSAEQVLGFLLIGFGMAGLLGALAGLLLPSMRALGTWLRPRLFGL